MKPALRQIDVENISVAAPAQQKRSAARAIAGLVVICGFAFLFGLGRLSLIGPDEPRFAEAGREMFATGDYVSPRVAGVLAFDKPALLYWSMAASYHVFGVGEFAARFPSALAATLSVLLLFHAIQSTLSIRLAFISAAALATSLLFLGMARAAVTDMLFASAISAALLCFYLYTTKNGRARSAYLIASAAATGLAVLAKGLVGVVLVVAILLATLIVTRQPRSIKWREMALWLSIFLITAAVWYLPVTLEHGRAFIDEFIIKHHFRRFLTNRYQHPQPAWFYPVVTLAAILPWTFFLIPAAARLRKLKPRGGNNRDFLLSLAWAWLAVPMVFFSLSQSKLPSYILPALPALAIIIGIEVERVWNGEKDKTLLAAAWLTGLLLVAFAIAFPIYLNRESLLSSKSEWAIYTVPLVIALAVIAAVALGKVRAVVSGAAAVVLILVIIAVTVTLPRLDDKLGLKKLSLEVASALKPDEKIAFYQNKNYAPVFYAEGRAVSHIGRGEGLNAYRLEEIVSSLETEGSLIVITTSDYEGDLTANSMFEAEPIASQGDHRALRVRLALARAEIEH